MRRNQVPKPQGETAIPMLHRRLFAAGCGLIALGAMVYQSGEADIKPVARIATEVLCFDDTLQPHIAGHDFSEQLAAFQDAIGKRETGNDWAAIQEHSKNKDLSMLGTGAYQYTEAAWGYVGGHQFAYLASPAMQYRKAKQDILNNYAQWGNWSHIAYMNSGSFEPSSCTQHDYVRRNGELMIALMNQNLADPKNIDIVPGLPLNEYNPQLADN